MLYPESSFFSLRKIHHGNLVCGRRGSRFFSLRDHRLSLRRGFPCCGSESLSNVVKGPSSGLRHSQVGEDEEEDEEDHEDDEDVRTTKFLRDEERDVCNYMTNLILHVHVKSLVK